MCARYTLTKAPAAIAALFDLALPDMPPRYNIAPTQMVPVLRLAHRRVAYAELRWGLVPAWADDIKIGHRLINARAETVDTKPAFRAAYRQRRCLVLADGYYEWQTQGKRKQPYWFRMRDESPFAFAGLWERWSRGEQTVESCTLITTAANDLARPFHDRMPAILAPSAYAAWLDPDIEEPEALREALCSFPDQGMRCDPANPVVNNVRHEGPDCVQPAEDASSSLLF